MRGCRWRSLEGNDPGAYELIMKCQALQRRLIQSIELGVEKDARIAELEGLRDELKAILARQPGAESALLISDLQVTQLPGSASGAQDIRECPCTWVSVQSVELYRGAGIGKESNRIWQGVTAEVAIYMNARSLHSSRAGQAKDV